MKTSILLSFLFLVSCAPKPESVKTRLSLKLPTSGKQSALRHYSPKSQFGSNPISNLSDVDCYALIVRWDDSKGKCEDTAGNTLTHANEVFGSYPKGSNVEIEVTSGPARKFILIGFSYNSGDGTNYCPDFVTFPIADQILASKPMALGSKTVDVQGEFMEITLTRSITSQIAHTCRDAPFQWETDSTAVWDVAVWDQASWGL